MQQRAVGGWVRSGGSAKSKEMVGGKMGKRGSGYPLFFSLNAPNSFFTSAKASRHTGGVYQLHLRASRCNVELCALS